MSDRIWKTEPDLTVLNSMQDKTIHGPLGIVFTAVGPDWLEATMPVDARTHQPAGLLHGGASVVLAESLGSVAAMFSAGGQARVVGIEVSASHLRAVRSGVVTGRASPIRIGTSVHVWEIKIRDEQDRPVCVSRLTVMVLK
jgi:1,4-dihydroxy-2-naphthoyl-CoA hydrolase